MSEDLYPFRASSYYRSYLCPSWHTLARLAGPEPENEVAAENTRLHAAVAGNVAVVDGALQSDRLTDAQDEIVGRAIKFAADKCAEFPDEKMLCEYEFPVEIIDDDGSAIITGTADLVLIGKDRITVIDWKFNFQPLDRTAAYAQLGVYAAAIDQATGGGRPIDVWIYMPRLEKEYHHRFEEKDLAGIVTAVKNQRRLVESANLRLNPSPSACHLCPALSICPAAARKFETDLVPITAGMDGRELVSLEQKERALLWFREYRGLFEKEWRRDIKLAIEHGYESEHFEIEPRSGKRSFTDQVRAWQTVKDLVPAEVLARDIAEIPVPALIESAARSYAAVRESAGEKVTLKAARAEIARRLSPWIQRSDGTTALVVKK